MMDMKQNKYGTWAVGSIYAVIECCRMYRQL